MKLEVEKELKKVRKEISILKKKEHNLSDELYRLERPEREIKMWVYMKEKKRFVKEQNEKLKLYQQENDWMEIVECSDKGSYHDPIDKIYNEMYIKLKEPIYVGDSYYKSKAEYFYFSLGEWDDGIERPDCWEGTDVWACTEPSHFRKLYLPLEIRCKDMVQGLRKFKKYLDKNKPEYLDFGHTRL